MSDRRFRGFMKRSYRYARDYTISPDGQVHYHGALYEFVNPDSAEMFKRFVIQSGIIAVMMLVCGFLPVFSMRLSAFVIFPYGIDLIAAFILLVSCIRLLCVPSPMEQRMFDTSYSRLLPVSAIVALASSVAFIGHLVFVLTHLYLGVALVDFIFAAAMAVAAALGVLIFLSSKKIRFRSYDA